MPAPRDPAPVPTSADLNFEEAMRRVEALIQRIETGEVGLEQSLLDYEQGVQLLKHCRAVLDRAEQKVTDLTAQMNAGAPASSNEPRK